MQSNKLVCTIFAQIIEDMVSIVVGMETVFQTKPEWLVRFELLKERGLVMASFAC
jgi:hypothetical protein